MSLIELSKERARSKALLLGKISQNHQLDKSTDKISRNLDRKRDNPELANPLSKKTKAIPRHHNEVNDESIEILLSICGQTSDRFREYFKDNVLNKSIIIESNSSKAKAASKTNLRRERQQKRRIKLSNRLMKRRSLLNDSSIQFSSSELKILHSTFYHYLLQVSEHSQGINALQTKLASAELIGAEIYILKTSHRYKFLQGSVAIIVAKTETVISIVCSKDLNNNQNVRAVKLRRADISFAFLLPSQSDTQGDILPSPSMTRFVTFLLENSNNAEVKETVVDEGRQEVLHDSGYQFISFSNSEPTQSNMEVSSEHNNGEPSSNVEAKGVRKSAVIVVKGATCCDV